MKSSRSPASQREPHKFDPEFKGPLKNRSCTDIICLFLFVFFLVGWGIVAFFAYRNGNPERLIYPTDSQGNICGKAPFEDKKYLYFFDITKCLQRAYKPGDLLPSLICNTPQVCVERCPNETFSVENAKGTKDELRPKLICQYGVDPLDKSVTVDDLVNKDQRCAKYYLKSSSVARRCLPGRLVKEGDQLKDELNDGFISAFSASGISKNTKDYTEMVLAGLSSAKDAGELAFQDFKTAWPLMLIGLLAAMVVAFLWIVLMRWLATIMVWLSILCLIVLFSFGSYYSFSKYVELRKGSDSSGGGLVQDFDVSISFTQNLRAYTANKNTWLFLGIVSAVILLILLILLIFLRKRIVIAIALIKEASRAVALMPSALFFPLLPYLLHLLLFTFWGSVAVYLASSGKADYKYMNMTAGNESMTTKDCTFEDVNKTSTIDGLKCQFAQYITNQHLSRAQIYNVIGLIWGMFFIVGLGQVALAAAFASYYWAFRKPQDVPFFAVLNGLCLTLRYHLGSVAFGSLILTIVRCIRIVLEYVDAKLKKYDNQFTKCLLRCCKCCFWCLEKFLKFLNKNAYIMIAIYGKNFCTSAKEAFKLLMRNVVRVVVLDKVTDLLLLVGKLVIVGIVAIPTFFVFTRKVDFLNGHVPELNYYMLPVLTISVGAYIIASSFFSVYGMAVDTLFLCFLEDCERHDGSEEKPYFMSKELMKILDKKNKFQDATNK